MPRWLHALPPALLLAAALVSPVRAGMFDDEEARKRIELLKGDFAELSRRADTINRNQIDFANQVEAIKADIAKLRGQIEVLAYELEATQKRQKDFYVDLDNRLRKLEPAPAEARPDARADPQGPAAKVDPAQETRDYETALAGLKASKFKEAGAAFVAFIKAYPNSSLIAWPTTGAPTPMPRPGTTHLPRNSSANSPPAGPMTSGHRSRSKAGSRASMH